MIDTDEILQTFSRDGFTIELVKGAAEIGDAELYGVVARAEDDEEREEFTEYGAAYSHFRTVVRQAFGENLPYQAPAFVPAAPAVDGTSIFMQLVGELTPHGAGSARSVELLERMRRDPDFRTHAPEILARCAGPSSWVKQAIAVTARLAMSDVEAEVLAVVENVPGFGRF